MSERVTKALWAVCIALFAAPLHAVVISTVPICSLCSPLPGVTGTQSASEFDLDAGLAGAALDLNPPVTGFVEVNLPDLDSVVDTLVEQAGLLVPSANRPTSALGGIGFSAAPCQNCGDQQGAQEASAGGVRMKGFLLVLILSVVVIAIAVPLIFFVRHLRSLEADEIYIRERWGVKSRDF